jgi:hypothetical protein
MPHSRDMYLFERLNNPQVVKNLIHAIKTNEEVMAQATYANIALQCSDHPRFIAIHNAYKERFNDK